MPQHSLTRGSSGESGAPDVDLDRFELLRKQLQSEFLLQESDGNDLRRGHAHVRHERHWR